ncbi:aminotransferase class V-fold PLP-dependent enzyme [Burkholderia glumae]|uniref:Aminotransferase class V-fold PLP-dependent enzyme n=1 Tax=Burkholderia glumae TaxID=337 RepID=A0AAP9Y4V3_BURGL|nr:aminotransferase class V-fold PLP-dependent enzyme [Burkholderia glumae]AJY67702.1 aminotransferase class-V family protein [Burkholderia glumae LMG 2196 = ATCC 33617]MCM2483135.1 aminotransferase class V-fold PLP-dependent enzyme [Burkholderia glumae]MCM2506451.1 aminotransferase class V-fold PLP-dependent enzyme [Burkholderia glumae]MCM2538122.1 aminotransferase class V-fold PLP-dependent enzyme [Burkholderia glumae]NVE21658.1 aminotransferase class V-fold PLP-dependent enzyme [Burkholderi
MLQRFDVAGIRRLFPIADQTLYFDSARHTPLAVPVRRALERFLAESEAHAGPKSVWLDRGERVREKMAKLIGARPEEVAFTKNTSDGLNIAANAIPFCEGDEILLNNADHPNIGSIFRYRGRGGVNMRSVDRLRTSEDLDTLVGAIGPRVKAVVLSHVAFDSGFRSDIEMIGQQCAETGAYWVVDGIQSVGVLPFDVDRSRISLAAFGCNKGLLTPPGLGVMYCRSGQPQLQPLYAPATCAEGDGKREGDRDDAKRFEYGLANLPALHALDAALDLITDIGVADIAEHVLDLGEYLSDRMAELRVGVLAGGPRARRSHICLLDLPGPGWQTYLAENRVRFSMERDGVRIAFAMFNTRQDVDQLVELIRDRLHATGDYVRDGKRVEDTRAN